MNPDDPKREADQLDGVPLPEERQVVVGHTDLRTELYAQLGQRRIPGAMLLHGPRGIGKATLAFDYARQVLAATSDETIERIGAQIAAGVHPNVFVLRRTPNKSGSNFSASILIDQISRRPTGVSDPLIERLHRTRGRAGYRICIVDSIDDCNNSAANALLKILEEPPPETLFILVSHRPGSLLPTIRSRCHAHAIRPLDDELVGELIQSEPGEGALIREAIALSYGSPRRAYEIIRIGNAKVLKTLGSWLDAPATASTGAHLHLADAIASASETEKQISRELIRIHIVDLARNAAIAHDGRSNRLASATDLWEKANTMFADADTYNLDARQTLVGVFDAIRIHARQFSETTTGTE